MTLAKVIVGPADVFHYVRNTTSISAASQLGAGNCSSATEEPAIGIDGATRIQATTAYNLSVVYYGAHEDGGLAVTAPPTNYEYTTGSGHNAIKVAGTAPAKIIAVGLLVNDALAAINATSLTVRNGSSAAYEVVCYYEPSAKAITRTDITTEMGAATVYGWDRKSFGETTGPTQLQIQPVTATVQRNQGSDIPLVTAFNAQISCSLLASGKESMASVLNGIATKKGGLKTNQSANFGFRGLGVPSARPVEVVGPGESAGEEDSVIFFSALKLSSEAITKAWEKENASQLPVVFVSAEDIFVKGTHGAFEYTKN